VDIGATVSLLATGSTSGACVVFISLYGGGGGGSVAQGHGVVTFVVSMSFLPPNTISVALSVAFPAVAFSVSLSSSMISDSNDSCAGAGALYGAGTGENTTIPTFRNDTALTSEADGCLHSLNK